MISRFIRKNPMRYEEIKTHLRERLPISRQAREKVTDLINTFHQKYIEDFAFIHIPKCGGTSIERALGLPFLNHDTALERREKLGAAVWNTRTTFAVVRNPYDRMASAFFHWQRPQDTDIASLRIWYHRWLHRVREKHQDNTAHKVLKSQRWWLDDPRGDSLVDIVCKIENIDKDIETVAASLGRKISVSKLNARQVEFKLGDVYNDATRTIIKMLYTEDFERFGYEM